MKDLIVKKEVEQNYIDEINFSVFTFYYSTKHIIPWILPYVAVKKFWNN